MCKGLRDQDRQTMLRRIGPVRDLVQSPGIMKLGHGDHEKKRHHTGKKLFFKPARTFARR